MPGVFGLREARIEQIKNISTSSFRYWSESAKYGYFAGGDDASPTNLITRLDFSNETLNNPGNNLPTVRYKEAGISNNSYGYIGGGGGPPGYFSTITRLDFSNETISNLVSNLPIPVIYVAAVFNNSYGYFGGGSQPITTSASQIARLDFSNETISNPGKSLSPARQRTAGVSNNSYGYFSGGQTGSLAPSSISTITRLDFSNEVVSDPGKNFVTTRTDIAGVSNNSYGYFGGGNGQNTITRLDFSNETVSDPGNNLPTARSSPGGVYNNSYGYFAGGFPTIATITRLDFSNETVSNPGNNLPTARGVGASLSGGASVLRPNKTYGYFAGGATNPPIICTIIRLDFSNETASLPAKDLPTARFGIAGVSNNSYGYFGGGQSTFSSSSSIISRLDFSNEIVSNPGKNFIGVRGSAAGVFNNSYGYFGGGYNPPNAVISTITRLDFSNEVVSNPGNNLPLFSERQKAAGVFNNSYGYFGGGALSPTISYSTITRLDFSNEVVSNPGNNFVGARDSSGSVSNNSYGYFGGGEDAPLSNRLSTITRLDFSIETVSDPGKNFPTIPRRAAAGVSNNSYGYFGGGGRSAVGGGVSIITRLDFSTETASNLGNILPDGDRFGAAGVTNSN
jgi:hypothetical protein